MKKKAEEEEEEENEIKIKKKEKRHRECFEFSDGRGGGCGRAACNSTRREEKRARKVYSMPDSDSPLRCSTVSRNATPEALPIGL
ncbi:hypothetical protein M0804_005299 [Polistes exclamans]|nr:hypothetical protein M0804_005299 [Polistes exclamans]